MEGIGRYILCMPGMGSPRYKDSGFSKWYKSTGSELVKLPSKSQGRLASLIVTTFLGVGVTRGLK
jgi:hypothetical protein